MSAVIIGCSTKDPNVVATVLDKKISIDDFRLRYKQYLENTNSRDNIVLRQTILNNMINEIIIYHDVHTLGMDQDSAAQNRLEQIQLQALLDEYSKMITIDTMTISNQEYLDEFRNYNSKVKASYVYGKTEKEAWKLKERIDRGESFQTVARGVFQDPGLANNGGDLGFFGWNEMEQGIEEFAFRERVGSISDPIKISAGYAIVKIEKRVQQPLASEYDFAKDKMKLERVIRERKTVHYLKNVTASIAKSFSATFNENAVASILENWELLSVSSGVVQRKSEMSLPKLDLASKFATINKEQWTVGDFLVKLERATPKQRKRVKTIGDIHDIALGLAVRGELIKRAKEQHLESNERVSTQIKIATERYLLARWSDFVEDILSKRGISEEELKEHYNKFAGQYAIPPEVNVAEILVRTQREAIQLRKQIDAGSKFTALAKKHSIRLWAANNGGELGFGSRSTYGILADTFFTTNIGAVIGPAKVDPYFGIYKILEKRDGNAKPFHEVRNEVLQQVLATKINEGLKSAVSALRSRVTVETDKEILANINLN